MSACIGAQAAGGRTMTATSANGLALMWEMLYIAASSRLPVTLACVNRALSGPLIIHNDHGDSMGARDSGWVQLYSENNQEAYDNFIQAVRIGEHKDVILPVMVCQDGFITSHAVENIDLLEDDKVKAFVGEYNPDHYLLNSNEPIAVGPLDLPNYYFEHRRQQAQAMINAKNVILDVAKDFEKLTGRKYELFEKYMLDDAEIAIVIINSTAGTAKSVVDDLREKGIKAGLLKIRVFRPFPAEEIAAALKHVKALAVMDKAEGFSAVGGPLYADVKAALYGVADGIKVVNYIYGLGGRDVKTDNIELVYSKLQNIIKTGQTGETYRYVGVRE
jgi:pyruvate ferredoxin oxidoreductase alpha subunit